MHCPDGHRRSERVPLRCRLDDSKADAGFVENFGELTVFHVKHRCASRVSKLRCRHRLRPRVCRSGEYENPSLSTGRNGRIVHREDQGVCMSGMFHVKHRPTRLPTAARGGSGFLRGIATVGLGLAGSDGPDRSRSPSEDDVSSLRGESTSLKQVFHSCGEAE